MALWFARAPQPSATARAHATGSATEATQAVSPARPARGVVLPDALIETRPLVGLLADPTVDAARRWRALNALGDPFAAQLQAVNSGDPVLLYGAFRATFHCFSLAVHWHGKEVRETMTRNSRDPKTGLPVPPAEDEILMNEAVARFAPQRLLAIPAVREEVGRNASAWSTNDVRPDAARTAELFRLNAAPLSADERALYDAAVARAARECGGRISSTELGRAYREQTTRLIAQGVLSAQLFNAQAGWTSGPGRELSPRDYDLLERAFLDAQPDTWARLLLLSPTAIGELNAGEWPDDLQYLVSSMMLQLALGPLSACALSLYDCGPNSAAFRSMCMDFGGCDQSDLEALLKYVFRRDGLDPGIIDREIERVLTMYRNRDFAALGYRRKSSG